MADFASQIKGSTCISDEYKEKLLAVAESIPEDAQKKILEVLTKGEEKKTKMEKEHKKGMVALIKKHLAKLKEFKRGPLRKAKKKVEEVDRAADSEAAEDLLKDL